MVNLKLIGQCIGNTLREMRFLHFYTYGLLPLILTPAILAILGLFYVSAIFVIQQNYIQLVMVMLLLGLILIFILYYIQHKTTQYVIYRRMEKIIAKKDKEELESLDKTMTLLQNNIKTKTFWFGFFSYIVLMFLFALFIMLTYGISRLFYYDFIQTFGFTLFVIFLYPVLLYLNSSFFYTLSFFKTVTGIKKIYFFDWAFVLIFDFILSFIALGLFAVFPYLFPLYIGFFYSIIIIFNTFVYVNREDFIN